MPEYLPYQKVLDAIEAQLDVDFNVTHVSSVLLSDYSGREMYGRTCIAFVVDHAIEATLIAIRIFEEQIALGHYSGIEDMLLCQQVDTLGSRFVVYFPNYLLDNNPYGEDD